MANLQRFRFGPILCILCILCFPGLLCLLYFLYFLYFLYLLYFLSPPAVTIGGFRKAHYFIPRPAWQTFNRSALTATTQAASL